ncbi:Tryptophan 5-hydroxylase [Seminavis robusta]|uniref:phenylalanine 4-monooxygenase n=1 Tax=Seminavis robusta TaxID=568900 RepID=A0A9N8H0H9_9STRA|nr:Tryptophan 5-hydroxylase [Seminavis robusta]|eukprot:Sro2_g001720.1 Tryptophan 5-hydroxylase (544) ;mRNA; f:232439-234228
MMFGSSVKTMMLGGSKARILSSLAHTTGRRLVPRQSSVLLTNRWFSSDPHRIQDNSASFNNNSHYSLHTEPAASINSNESFLTDEKARTSILMELSDRVGVLHDVLKHFWKYDINVTRIESRPLQKGCNNDSTQDTFDFYLDFDGDTQDDNVQQLLQALKPLANKVLILDSKDVYWFPRHISELDLVANRTLDAGVDLESDHPGFHDTEYRARRAQMAENAQKHIWNKPIPRVQYTQNEKDVWSAVWDKMEGLLEQHACKEYLESMELMKKHCGYSRNDIPQQEDISAFLMEQSNFRMRPVAGLLSSRDFLNGLAFRVFFCTQYIRHHSKVGGSMLPTFLFKWMVVLYLLYSILITIIFCRVDSCTVLQPLYTPEPDICHELLGHAPMFADRDFADFSQEIGLASLGASDDDVQKLAHCYWHSVEFGLCQQDGKNKAYGAGLLSSYGELEYACADDHPGADEPPTIKPWDPEVAAHQAFPITTYQPVYFLAESLHDAKQRMRTYCEGLQRPFFALHNAQNDSIHIDRPVKRTRGVPTEEEAAA